MNLFVVGWNPAGVSDAGRALAAVTALVDELPFLDPSSVRSWESSNRNVVAVVASHARDQVQVSYARFEETRMALFAGRPLLVEPGGSVDGITALDPTTYLAPPSSWIPRLSGRCSVMSYDGATAVLTLVADSIGAHPVYQVHADGTTWLGNGPAALAAIAQANVDREGLASFFACGWGLGGSTLWDGVRRVPRGSVCTFGPGAATDVASALPESKFASYVGSGFDHRAAADSLVATVAGMSDWPGRQLRLSMSGGRDSRLIFAAAVAAGLEFEPLTFAFPNTPGFPETSDVRIARRVVEDRGRRLSVEIQPPGSGVRTSSRALRLVSNGLVSVATTGPLSFRETSERLPLVLSGQAGETSRAYYATDATDATAISAHLFHHVVPRYPAAIVSSEALESVRARIASWVAARCEGGIEPASIPDLFYVLERSANWAGPSHAAYECVSDVMSPLWASTVVPHELAPTQEEREREVFGLRVLEILAPSLAHIPFDGVNPPWPGLRGPRSRKAHHARVMAFKAYRETRRRLAAGRSPQPAAGDPFLADLVQSAREWTTALPSHPAWDVLDHGRVTRLLQRNPASLDPRSTRQLATIASVFAGEESVSGA